MHYSLIFWVLITSVEFKQQVETCSALCAGGAGFWGLYLITSRYLWQH